MGILRVVTLLPTPYDREYWRMHVAAVLLCLHDHRHLETAPRTLLGDRWPAWTLADFRGSADRAAFSRMKASVQNWGAQYLLADVLHRDVYGLRTHLVQALSDVHGITLTATACVVAGRDSAAGDTFLRSCRARVLGDLRRRVATSRDVLVFTDLCLLAHESEPTAPVAIFGEVEGNHGEQLNRRIYWQAKSPYSLFGIGLVERQHEPALLTEIEGRIVITLGAHKSLFSDFHVAVSWVEKLIEHGPTDSWWRNSAEPTLADAIALVVQHWRMPVQEVLATLGYETDGTGRLIGREHEVPDIWTHQQKVRVTVPEPQLVVAA